MDLYQRHSHLYTNETTCGILCIENTQDDRILLVPSEDVAKDIQAIRFRLDLGTFEHKGLQEAYERIGLEVFSISVLATAKDKQALSALLQTYHDRMKALGRTFY